MVKNILFDFDGVILDNTKTLIEYHQKIAEKLGLRVPSVEEIFGYFGKPWDKVINGLWPEIDTDRFKAEFLSTAQENSLEHTITKGFKELLYAIKNEGFKTGIVTGNRKEFVVDLIKRSDIDLNKFDIIVASEDTTRHKPDPDPILFACNALNIMPEETVYIGDSLLDYHASQSANTHFIGFRWRGIRKEFYEKNGVFNSVTFMDELKGKIKRLQKMAVRRVVTCFLENNGRILLLRRDEASETYVGKWSAVHGNIEDGETPVETAKREIKEETGTEPELIKNGGIFDIEDEKLGVIWKIHPFLFKAETNKITLNEENDDYKWISPDDMEISDTVPMLKESFMVLSNKN